MTPRIFEEGEAPPEWARVAIRRMIDDTNVVAKWASRGYAPAFAFLSWEADGLDISVFDGNELVERPLPVPEVQEQVTKAIAMGRLAVIVTYGNEIIVGALARPNRVNAPGGDA